MKNKKVVRKEERLLVSCYLLGDNAGSWYILLGQDGEEKFGHCTKHKNQNN